LLFHSFHIFFPDFQLFQPEHHWKDLISRNAHLVHQSLYRIYIVLHDPLYLKAARPLKLDSINLDRNTPRCTVFISIMSNLNLERLHVLMINEQYISFCLENIIHISGEIYTKFSWEIYIIWTILNYNTV
jgi:hypothetical protein